MQVYLGPIGPELIHCCPVELRIFPLRGPHNVIVVVAEDIAVEAGFVQQFDILIGVVGDVADVEDPQPINR